MNHTFLLSFDEFAEVEANEVTWLRRATEEEVAVVENNPELHKHNHWNAPNPYLWVVIDDSAPKQYWDQAKGMIRLHRFK